MSEQDGVENFNFDCLLLFLRLLLLLHLILLGDHVANGIERT